ncbi:hypothetical protein [Catellatospora tritici]|uniref:hypothetical protein n=1 Tax=Catellatospora tritici TaxID=2851566 RepID=UPI001C2DD4EA|nr:hypothetical protein [Catellatospora tritici]MBV1855150.1 hypothetical protein [Catellatospora tritici]
MDESFDAYMRRVGADREAVQVAARYYLAEKSDYLDTDEIEAEVRSGMVDPARLPEALLAIESDPNLMYLAAAAVLSAAWTDAAERPAIKRAVDGARSKLPVLEVAMLALTSIYGMYLLATGGVKRTRTTQETRPDGSTSSSTETEYYSVEGPLASLVRLFRSGPN